MGIITIGVTKILRRLGKLAILLSTWIRVTHPVFSLRFPVLLICLVLLSLMGTSAVFGQHEVLVSSRFQFSTCCVRAPESLVP